MTFKINIIACLLLLASTSVVAQVKTVMPGKDFSSVKVSTGLFVEIVTNSEENKIEVKGSERDEVSIEIEQDELQLSLPVGQIFSETEILVTVYAKKVEELKSRAGSEVEFISPVRQENLNLIASEGSYIGGELQVDYLTVRSVTGASISLIGSANTSNIEVKTGASFDGKELKTEITEVSLNFGGEALVYATETCNASVNAGGTIMIYGNPDTLSQKVKLGGEITVIE
ncbi:head GIN domain-containing protein [Psychroflexus sediminis]|uniref:Putative auto-transporter adhesin, head GIN domain n=1 Tax=Psychroflexus sediminis TaxID=470826 RepID=A0A1G7YH48_9FLAO|nr:head GIN domain-containing protein [Psychroflexus sediminis]SDG95878.1 Putative auto-transporter adhesin, head GIN domain [Psychroflexus sediminis]